MSKDKPQSSAPASAAAKPPSMPASSEEMPQTGGAYVRDVPGGKLQRAPKEDVKDGD